MAWRLPRAGSVASRTSLSSLLLDSRKPLGDGACFVEQHLPSLGYWAVGGRTSKPAALEPDTLGPVPAPLCARRPSDCYPEGPWGELGEAPVPSPRSLPLTASPLLPGVLLGVRAVPGLGYSEDPELPGLFHPVPSMPRQPPALPEEGSPGAVYLLSKQGKSWHYQLWDYDQVRDSNLQLTDFSPSRAADGRAYVVPAGGVRAGLCGQALLLRPGDSSH